MLGKYYAGLIVLACMLAALLHPDRRSYFRSARPYLAAATCVIVLAPNLYWLIRHDFISITYHVLAEQRRVAMGGSNHALTIIFRSIVVVAAFIGSLSPALVALWLCLRPFTVAMARTIARDWPVRRATVGCIAFAPIVLPLVLMPLAGIASRDPWNYPAYFFVPLAIVSAPGLVVTYRATVAIVGAVAAVTLLVLAVSPLLMVANFIVAKDEDAAPLGTLARIATDEWHSRTGQPLEFVNGSARLAWAVTFYSTDHPRTAPDSNDDMSRAELEKFWNEKGVLGICGAVELWCNEVFEKALPAAQRMQITVANRFLGLHRAPVSYMLYLQPKRHIEQRRTLGPNQVAPAGSAP